MQKMHTLNIDRAHGHENCLYETTMSLSSADIIVAYKLLLFKISVLTVLLHCATSRDGENQDNPDRQSRRDRGETKHMLFNQTGKRNTY
jgi:hypothetical protein